MFKKYDPRLLHSYRSYKINDICRLYSHKKLHAQTVRKWIKDNKISAIYDGKIILIYGAILKQFFASNNALYRKELKFTEFHCMHCKLNVVPNNNSIQSLKQHTNGCIIAIACCSQCNNKMQRFYKHSMLQKITDTYEVKHNGLELLSDSVNSHHNTHIKSNNKLAISESSIQSEFTHAAATCNTRHKNKSSKSKTSTYPVQLRLFD